MTRLGSLRPLAAIIAVLAALAVFASLLISLADASPIEAAEQFWEGAFGSPLNFGQTITGAVPLLLVALAWIVSFRAGRIHVGFPGQIIVGGIFCSVVALHVHGLPAVIHLPLAMLAAMLGGALWAGIAAYLWAARGVAEIVSTLLLNLIAYPLLAWVVRGPLQESVGGQPQTDPFPASVRWPTVAGVEGGTLSWDVVLIPIAVAVVIFVMYRTTAGFRQQLAGANPAAARYAGYDPKRIGVVAMVASGALAGLAGACLLLAGETPGMTDSFEAGNGFNGLAAALLAFNSPIVSVLTAALFSALTVGSGAVEAILGIPATISEVLQGLVIILVLFVATVLVRQQRRGGGL